MRMRKRNPFVLLALLAALADAGAQTAAPPAPPTVWLRADQGAGTPTLWTDRSGHNLHATALRGQEPAAGGTLNFNPALVFDGVDDYMRIPYSPALTAGITMMAVFQPADTSEYGVWGAEEAVTRDMMLTTRRALGPEAALDEYTRGESRPVLSTVVQYWTRSVADSAAHLALGSGGRERPALPFRGTLAELLVFDRALGFLERLQMESYLALKYGLTLPGNNYVNSREQILWHGEDNRRFANRVAGIGRDDAFGLHQKQSASTAEARPLVVLSAGTLADDNPANPAVLPDGAFLLWGDDNAALTTRPDPTDPAVALVERRWLVRSTGNAAKDLATELRVDLTRLPPDSLGYWLVIDRSGGGDFAGSKVEAIKPDEISRDSMAIFRNVHWDTDGSGSDQFGLARNQPGDPRLVAGPNPAAERTAAESGGTAARRFDVRPNLVKAGEAYRVNVTLAEAGATRLKVYDTKGQLQGQMQGKDQAHYQFSGTGARPGVYVLVLETARGVETRKLVVY